MIPNNVNIYFITIRIVVAGNALEMYNTRTNSAPDMLYFLDFCLSRGNDWCMHYRNQPLRRVPEALGEALKTLGKGFAECNTRQRLCRV
jgi:hypothetical protein